MYFRCKTRTKPTDVQSYLPEEIRCGNCEMYAPLKNRIFINNHTYHKSCVPVMYAILQKQRKYLSNRSPMKKKCSFCQRWKFKLCFCSRCHLFKCVSCARNYRVACPVQANVDLSVTFLPFVLQQIIKSYFNECKFDILECFPTCAKFGCENLPQKNKNGYCRKCDVQILSPFENKQQNSKDDAKKTNICTRVMSLFRDAQNKKKSKKKHK